MRFRLKEAHPLYYKLEKLFEFLESAKIDLCWNPYAGFIVTHEGKEYNLLDQEDRDRPSLYNLPPTMEWKLCREASKEEEDEHLAKKARPVVG